ncbi:latent-transforming growth factor beta-binding protein 4 isoform X2 [Sorex fumeus]|uniref:latent-transforming growth factor beta-binding protein 4 isoform X2 n=1 Tax=Sorex fumeus TaxID=62283 RepID=UPI0024AE2351|nr:latent-transforming growth factor beta-binding protein 4 isoform X2 [Sorex fumeus]
MRQPVPRSRRPLLLGLLLSLLAAASAAASTASPGPRHAVEVAGIPGRPAGVPACRCCPGQSLRRSHCFRASCRGQNCTAPKCAGARPCLTPVPPSPSPSVKKRQVSLNWQPLTLQEARALLKRRRPRGPGGRSLLRRRPPQRAPVGQAPVLCPLICHNGGVCLRTDRCLCPPDFAGKFCQLHSSGARPPAPSTPGHTRSVYTMPLANHRDDEHGVASMVSVHVEHPQEASVVVHQVERVSGTWDEAKAEAAARAEAAAPYTVLAQSAPREDGYSDASGFGYCFRELRGGDCASPLPGLRTQDVCCRGGGLAWGVHDCQPCSEYLGNTDRGVDGPCPTGFERVNGSCQDVDECATGGRCQHGECANTRGGYTCVCPDGFLLDSSRSSCISQHVISEAKGPCFRVLRDGGCSLPILRNITKQICCCSRVGKAWGRGCQLCPPYGSEGFREICPAGPGYHYSASDLRYNTRPLSQDPPRVSVSQTRPLPATTRPPTESRTERRPQSRPEHRLDSRPERRPDSQPEYRPDPRPERRPDSQPEYRPDPRPEYRPDSRPERRQDPRPERRPDSRPERLPDSRPEHRPDPRPEHRPDPRPERRPEPRPGPELPVPSIPAWTGPETPETGACQRNPQVCGAGRCIPRPSGYTCACDPGYRLSPQGTRCIDVDECRRVPTPCTPGRCENTPGSFRCVCGRGYRAGPRATECLDVNECHRVPPPCDRGRCENTPGSFLCVCPAGYQAETHGASCQDVDECIQSPGLCGRGVCENLPGNFRCVCPAGFRGSSCEEDVDECAQVPPPCGPGRCDNTMGSYHCACPSGFRSRGPGAPCQDVDECARSPQPCNYGRCENTEGSFRCVCPTGFQPNAAGSACEDVDECENHLACPGQECVNSPGSFQCRACPVGHHLLQGRCTDVDECSSGASCGPHGHCTNTEGSFRCTCAPGYRAPSGQPGPCADVNECLEGDFCFPHGECLNTDGSFACTCAPGYRPGPRGASCLDVDECSEEDLCQSGICTNTDGSFECVCPPGHRASPDQASCQDVDECREQGPALCGSQRCENSPGSYRCVRDCDPGYHAGPEGTCDDVDECQEYGASICGTQRCENTPGSYRCVPACEPGYQPTPGGGCQDVDECRNRSFCGAHAVCQNLPGSFQCLCDQGYEGARDGRHCVDVNECETLQGVCGTALCENVEGSFLCVCPTSPEEFDPMTGRCVPPRRSSGSSGTFPGSQAQAPASPNLPARPAQPPPSARRPNPPRQGPVGSGRRECYFDTAAPDACDNILARNVTWQECCCTVGEGWGSGCRIQQCPGTETAEYQSLCPHGRGYLAPSGDPSLRRDVDECQLFRDQVCKSGVCVNTAPGYSCYCSNGFYYHARRMECVDNDECALDNDDEEPACEGGHCVNTVGSYHCTCEEPLVLDGSRRRCVTNESQSLDDNLGVCWQEVGVDLVCSRPRLDRQATYTECCCLYGEAWGMDCALCPAQDSDDFEALCNVLRPPAYSPPRPGGFGPPYEYGPDLGPPYQSPPYGPEVYPPPVLPYDPYPPPPGSFPRREDPYPPPPPPGPFPRREDPYPPPPPPGPFPRREDPYPPPPPPGPFPRREDPYPPPPPPGPFPRRGDPYPPPPPPGPFPRREDPYPPPPPPGPFPRRVDPYPPPPGPFARREAPFGAPFDMPDFEDDEESEGVPYGESEDPVPSDPGTRWRYRPRDTRGSFSEPEEASEAGAGALAGPYEGLEAEECGILDGCAHGRCVRVPEGFTCDCFDGYRLDTTRMSCVDINECDESELDAPLCVNARCVNTDGSFRCVCRPGFAPTHQPHHCAPARPRA